MNPNLEITIQTVSRLTISNERKEVLQPMIEFIQKKLKDNQPILLNFICTHNSRRSHLSQIWAQTMATYFDIPNVSCFSGGTEATALFSKVVETLQKQGFEILNLATGNNPVYAIKYDQNALPIIGFSKTYFHDFNPKTDYAAVVTCSSADENCPVVLGAEKRLSIRYEDPKVFDGTTEMDKKYWNKSLEIASEMYFVLSKVK
jgi:arsenate reductase (thioredoxin)